MLSVPGPTHTSSEKRPKSNPSLYVDFTAPVLSPQPFLHSHQWLFSTNLSNNDPSSTSEPRASSMTQCPLLSLAFSLSIPSLVLLPGAIHSNHLELLEGWSGPLGNSLLSPAWRAKISKRPVWNLCEVSVLCPGHCACHLICSCVGICPLALMCKMYTRVARYLLNKWWKGMQTGERMWPWWENGLFPCLFFFLRDCLLIFFAIHLLNTLSVFAKWR